MNQSKNLLAVLCTFALFSPTASFSQGELDPEDVILSPVMKLVMAQGSNAAAELLAPIYYERTIDDKITISNLTDDSAVRLARSRAEKVYAYLQADLNWDGQLTRSELEEFFSETDQNFVDGYLRDGDINNDGILTLSEMHEDAKRDLQSDSGISNGYLLEMLSWDLNGDGELIWEEILSVIISNTD